MGQKGTHWRLALAPCNLYRGGEVAHRTDSTCRCRSSASSAASAGAAGLGPLPAAAGAAAAAGPAGLAASSVAMMVLSLRISSHWRSLCGRSEGERLGASTASGGRPNLEEEVSFGLQQGIESGEHHSDGFFAGEGSGALCDAQLEKYLMNPGDTQLHISRQKRARYVSKQNTFYLQICVIVSRLRQNCP
jgi:hypothetical protein